MIIAIKIITVMTTVIIIITIITYSNKIIMARAYVPETFIIVDN